MSQAAREIIASAANLVSYYVWSSEKLAESVLRASAVSPMTHLRTVLLAKICRDVEYLVEYFSFKIFGIILENCHDIYEICRVRFLTRNKFPEYNTYTFIKK